MKASPRSVTHRMEALLGEAAGGSRQDDNKSLLKRLHDEIDVQARLIEMLQGKLKEAQRECEVSLPKMKALKKKAADLQGDADAASKLEAMLRELTDKYPRYDNSGNLDGAKNAAQIGRIVCGWQE